MLLDIFTYKVVFQLLQLACFGLNVNAIPFKCGGKLCLNSMVRVLLLFFWKCEKFKWIFGHGLTQLINHIILKACLYWKSYILSSQPVANFLQQFSWFFLSTFIYWYRGLSIITYHKPHIWIINKWMHHL